MRKPRRSSRPAAVALDHGPAIRHARGEVVVIERADPDSPNRTVRGARVAVGYHVLWAQGLITDDMHEAADRLTMALEWAQGAKEGGADFSGVRLAPWQKGHPSARQIQAAADLADARGSLGLGSYENAVSAIGANVWPWEWGGGSPAPQHWDRLPKEALDHLRVSLQILVQVWRIDA